MRIRGLACVFEKALGQVAGMDIGNRLWEESVEGDGDFVCDRCTSNILSAKLGHFCWIQFLSLWTWSLSLPILDMVHPPLDSPSPGLLAGLGLGPFAPVPNHIQRHHAARGVEEVGLHLQPPVPLLPAVENREETTVLAAQATAAVGDRWVDGWWVEGWVDVVEDVARVLVVRVGVVVCV